MTPTGEITEERPHPFGGKKPEKKTEGLEEKEIKEEKEIDQNDFYEIPRPKDGLP